MLNFLMENESTEVLEIVFTVKVCNAKKTKMILQFCILIQTTIMF